MSEDTPAAPEEQSVPEDRNPQNLQEQAAKQTDQELEPADQKEALPEVQTAVADAGQLKKKVTVTVPQQRVAMKYDEVFGELSRSAQVPGFRVGHAPRRLIEKRFGKEVAEDVRNQILGQALGEALEKSGLKTIGEPELDVEKIELPESGPLEFSFEVEVMPEFDLPELKGIKVSRPNIEITAERVEQQLSQWQAMRGTYEHADEAAADGDAVVVTGKVLCEGVPDAPVVSQALRVAPGQVEGIPIMDLGKVLVGKKAGDSASVKVTVPQAHANEAWRGKEVTVDLSVSDVRKRRLPPMDDAFATSMGFDNLEHLRSAVRARMQTGIEAEARGQMRSQVEKHLLESTKLDVPAGVAARHSENLLARRYVDLMQRGLTREQIEEHLTELKASAQEQAQRDLKLRFILAKIIEKENIDTDDGEINARVAAMARQLERRPERLRQDLQADGRLEEVAVAIREEKALDLLLKDADVTVVDEKAQEPQQPQAKQDESNK